MDPLTMADAIKNTAGCIEFAQKGLKARLKRIEEKQQELTKEELMSLWVDAKRFFNNKVHFRKSKDRMKQRIMSGG